MTASSASPSDAPQSRQHSTHHEAVAIRRTTKPSPFNAPQSRCHPTHHEAVAIQRTTKPSPSNALTIEPSPWTQQKRRTPPSPLLHQTTKLPHANNASAAQNTTTSSSSLSSPSSCHHPADDNARNIKPSPSTQQPQHATFASAATTTKMSPALPRDKCATIAIGPSPSPASMLQGWCSLTTPPHWPTIVTRIPTSSKSVLLSSKGVLLDIPLAASPGTTTKVHLPQQACS